MLRIFRLFSGVEFVLGQVYVVSSFYIERFRIWSQYYRCYGSILYIPSELACPNRQVYILRVREYCLRFSNCRIHVVNIVASFIFISYLWSNVRKDIIISSADRRTTLSDAQLYRDSVMALMTSVEKFGNLVSKLSKF